MATDARNQVQQSRHRLTRLYFRAIVRLAREERYDKPDEITPAMEPYIRKLYETYHAIALNEGA